MRIVDAQIHLWGSGLPSNMAHRQVTSFTTEEAVGLMDEGGVDAAVIHPPGWDPNSTEMAFKAVRDFPGRFAILGAFPLSSPDKRALVETWRSQPGMLGLRYGFLQEPMRGWLADGTLDWLWAAAERAGVPIAMLATDSLPHIGRIAERHPGLRLTIDHLGGRGGNTTLKDDAAMEHNAVESIRRWWRRMGIKAYPRATALLILADAGGSNGYRSRLWKARLHQVAVQTGLRISVCHFPPGTSKWNKIEHRMFCHITENWRGQPLVSHEVIIQLIGGTTTTTGLTIHAGLDKQTYPTGVTISRAELSRMRIRPASFHSDWNYTIHPRRNET